MLWRKEQGKERVRKKEFYVPAIVAFITARRTFLQIRGLAKRPRQLEGSPETFTTASGNGLL